MKTFSVVTVKFWLYTHLHPHTYPLVWLTITLDQTLCNPYINKGRNALFLLVDTDAMLYSLLWMISKPVYRSLGCAVWFLIKSKHNQHKRAHREMFQHKIVFFFYYGRQLLSNILLNIFFVFNRRNSNRFQTTWGRVNGDRIFVFFRELPLHYSSILYLNLSSKVDQVV